MGKLKNWAITLACLGAVSACADVDTNSTTPTATSSKTQAVTGHRKLIMFLWDGFPYSDINPTDTPNLWAMMQQGVNFTDNHSTFPTFTMVNSGTMATGAFPGKAGIYDNILWQPGPTGKDSGGKAVDYSQPVDLTDYAILTTLDQFYGNQLLLVGTLFQAAQAAGLKTAAIGKSGPAFIQDYKRGGVILDEKFAWPLSFAQGMQAAGFKLPKLTTFAYPPGAITLSPTNGDPTAISPTVFMADGVTSNPATATTSLWRSGYNYLLDSYLNYVLPVEQPDVSFVWVRDPDGTAHTYGASAATRDGLRAQDAYLGQLRAKLAALGIDGNTDIMILADHGRSSYSGSPSLFPLRSIVAGQVGPIDPNGFSVSGEVRMADLLSKNGFTAFDGRGCGYSPVTSGIKADGTQVNPTQIDTTGSVCKGAAGAKYTWPARLIPAVLPSNAIVVSPNAGADFIHVPSHDPALVASVVRFLQSREEIGAVFVRGTYGAIPGTLPLDLVNLDNPNRNADIVVSYTYDDQFVLQGNPGIEYAAARISPNWRGNHGTFGPADVHNVMIAYGPDFRSGFADALPSGNVDAAPTAAAVLGLSLPQADGRVLSEALAGNSEANYSVQNNQFSPSSQALHLSFKLPTSVTGADVDPTADTYTSTLKVKDLTTPDGHSYRYFDEARARRYLDTPPTALCQDVTEVADGTCHGASVSVDAGSHDADGEPVTCVQTPNGPYQQGANAVTLTCTDSHQNQASCQATVTVVDQTPPVIDTKADANGFSATIWPPNGKMHSISLDDCIASITDQCDGALSTSSAVITRITSDEGGSNEAVITSATTADVRADRDGNGDGRVYTISYSVSDASGNTSDGTCKVGVPHDKGGHPVAQDSGTAWCTGSNCPNH